MCVFGGRLHACTVFFLASRFSPTQVDVFAALLAKYASERLDKYPHVQRYVNHMLSFPTDVQTRYSIYVSVRLL